MADVALDQAVVGSHRTVRSTAVTAWRTGGCTGLAAAYRRSTAGTGRTELGLPWVVHGQGVHAVVLA